jgi:hypothetical protein
MLRNPPANRNVSRGREAGTCGRFADPSEREETDLPLCPSSHLADRPVNDAKDGEGTEHWAGQGSQSEDDVSDEFRLARMSMDVQSWSITRSRLHAPL